MKKIKILVSITFFLSGLRVNAQTDYALNFNGTSDYVDMGSSAAGNIRTVECWFKPTSNIVLP
jgi:hypothetical protein